MLFQRCQLGDPLIRFKICPPFYRLIGRLYKHQPALFHITSVVGIEHVIPIELENLTWQILPWDEIHSNADLLAMCARQLQRQDKDLEEATLHLQHMRLKRKERHDKKYGIHHQKQSIDDVFLLHDMRNENNMSRKLAFK